MNEKKLTEGLVCALCGFRVVRWYGTLYWRYGIVWYQWRRNRGFRRFNEPGPASSWGPE